MKQKLIFSVFVFAIVNLYGQTYFDIDFVGTGGVNPQTIHVSNLTRGSSVLIQGSDVLRLDTINTSVQQVEFENNQLTIFPNPMDHSCQFEFVNAHQGSVNVQLHSIEGKQLYHYNRELPQGKQVFLASGISAGVYVLSVKTGNIHITGRFVAKGQEGAKLSIMHTGEMTSLQQKVKSQTKTAIVEMPYSLGDELKFIGTAVGYANDTIVASPTESQTFTFQFTATKCGAYVAPDVWKEFMCHNLGANTSLDPFTYSEGINGDLYQWGRPTDGHEKRTSATTTTLASSNTPGHSSFIFASDDWRGGGGNNTRWTDGEKAANDPCPEGFKVPSQAQWAGVAANNQRGTWAEGCKFGDKLFLPASGYRNPSDGSLGSIGWEGSYWSSAVSGTFAYSLVFGSDYVDAAYGYYRVCGFSVRCIKESPLVPLATLTTHTISNISSTTATGGGNISSDGGEPVIARGVCWSTTTNPTVDLTTKTTDGKGTGDFISLITGLVGSTTYYVRAYASNSGRTAYGGELSFTTDEGKTTGCGAYIAPNVWKEFMCHNLGANTVLDSMTYNVGINGDLYQWGRPSDGHEKRTSATTSTQATTNTPGHASFIIGSADWRSAGGNDTRWTELSKAENDPCPSGFKVPSQAQWAGVVANNQRGTWASGYKFGDKLFLPASGYRAFGGGSLSSVGSNGNYWSSTVNGSPAHYLYFNNGNVSASYNGSRAYGFSVRCVVE